MYRRVRRTHCKWRVGAHLRSVEDPLNLCGMIRTELREVMQLRWLPGKVRKKRQW